MNMQPMMMPTVVIEAVLNCRITSDATIQATPTTIHIHHSLAVSCATASLRVPPNAEPPTPGVYAELLT
jgi:hypothetical protein